MIHRGRAGHRQCLLHSSPSAWSRCNGCSNEYQPASEDSEFWIAPESVPECVEIRNGFELLVSIERESDLWADNQGNPAQAVQIVFQLADNLILRYRRSYVCKQASSD